MRETRPSGSEGGAGFNPLSLPLSSQLPSERRTLCVMWSEVVTLVRLAKMRPKMASGF